MKKLLSSLMVLGLLVSLGACGDDTKGGATTGGSTLTIDSADSITTAYTQSALEATSGEIKVTFNNKGALPHNWTLAKEADVEALDSAAATNAPSYNAPGALAQTNMLDAGGSDTVIFTLEPGTYTYFCTFPGHLAQGMKGTLVVK